MSITHLISSIENDQDMTYKDDNTSLSQATFYILFVINSLLAIFAVRNIARIMYYSRESAIGKLTFFNFWIILVAIARLTYESDVFVRLGGKRLKTEVYVFFGVLSVILFDNLMMLCAYYWYRVVVLICLNIQQPPISYNKVKIILFVVIALNTVAFFFNFVTFIIRSQLTVDGSIFTSVLSIVNGVVFALSATLLYSFISKFSEVDIGTKNMVKRAAIIGYCAMYRCLIDFTFYFEFSGDLKQWSQKNNNLFWPAFMLIYFIISDIIPTFLFLQIFSNNAENRNNRLDIESRISAPLMDGYHGQSLNDDVQLFATDNRVSHYSRVHVEKKCCEIILKHKGLLAHPGTVLGRALHGYKVVALLFAGQWCPPCREFSTKLKAFYEEINQTPYELEIIFVSGDYDDKAFTDYYSSMPWLALPYDDPERETIIDDLEIEGIPELFIINHSGNIVTRAARTDFEKLGTKAYYKWLSIMS